MSVIFTSQEYSKYKSSGNDGNPYIYYMTVDVLSQDVATNSSSVLFTLYMKAKVGSGTLMWNIPNGSAPTTSITVDGTVYNSTTNLGNSGADAWVDDGDFRRYKRSATAIAICSKTLTIPHDINGERYISIMFKWTAGTTVPQYYPATFTSNGATVQLPSIARTGTLNVPASILVDNNLLGEICGITSYADYWYDLSYTIDGNTYQALTKQEIDTTNYSFTVATSWLLSNCSVQTANLVFTLTTYADSGGNTLIGTTTATSMVSIKLSDYLPTASLAAISPHSDGLNGRLVAGISTARTTYTVTYATGATSITQTFSSTPGTLQNYTSTSTTSPSSGSVRTNVLPASEVDYTLTIGSTAVDSRGATCTATAVTATVYGYQAPTLNMTAYRVGSNGDTNEDGAGTYVYVALNASTSTDVDGQNSIQSTSIVYNGNTLSNPDWVSLPAVNSGTFTFSATDNISTKTGTITVPPASYALDLIDADGTAQHLGAAIAGPLAIADKIKLGTTSLLELDMIGTDFQFFPGSEFVANESANSTDANNLFPSNNLAIKMFSATSSSGRTNWPTTRARAVIVALRLTSAYGMQLCWGNTDNIIYQRVYNNGTWGAWKSITFS